MRNASLGDFVDVRTSYSVLTQTQTVQHSLLQTKAIWYSLLILDYKPVQHVTVLNTVGNCNTVVLYDYIIILWDHRRICGPSLTETTSILNWSQMLTLSVRNHKT